MGLDPVVVVTVLTRLHGIDILSTTDLISVPCPLFLELSELVTGVLNLFTKNVAAISLLGDITLSGEDLGLTAGDLLAS